MHSSGGLDLLGGGAAFFFWLFFDSVSSSHGGVFRGICSSDFLGDWSPGTLLGLGTGLLGFGKWTVSGKDFSLRASASSGGWGAWLPTSFSLFCSAAGYSWLSPSWLSGSCLSGVSSGTSMGGVFCSYGSSGVWGGSSTVSGKVGAWLPGVAGGRASRENVGAKDRGAGGDAFGGALANVALGYPGIIGAPAARGSWYSGGLPGAPGPGMFLQESMLKRVLHARFLPKTCFSSPDLLGSRVQGQHYLQSLAATQQSQLRLPRGNGLGNRVS